MMTSIPYTGRRPAKSGTSRFGSLFEHAVVGLYRTFMEGRITIANPAMCDMFGYASAEEFAAKGCVDGFASLWTLR